ncbi:MAG: dTMP kinase [Candidatus Taylorbacteria bacterium RIFCSPHIGHO2_02_FULL_47_18]|uniref:Thymidylate kinase n=1 Tax=Candidatus Taylorbacteria bacterium RIFCSPLOWO2_01_FULL_48_100 TaxID=1802322 RepID=A0A1G2NGV8_9BACT|nr:MAG: dTMP kinase [Candidatus Taylorbacteria bacterium RIFCSPHIGHO2_01_FULL_48_38]OHA27518.1 MAG: dTMP kinase [Candidatus Taylorbacteria bacterium RIFCSPHIGHO2_02_FULL_47_18]OHA34582.1 MAG: dTMP kinase [Candidatus Taylorbacteria bacterium RIFCSPLOWO2_01_FULL_48_100]OHA40345.1 MAG: dTMP kinase [Candidatus Taylorbacteria bacterium RIFCSPLOWO2_02_FULL_48_16]OHA45230.1 MAG: dTMP kinase [Candidatus Taylorbacteria bacterium RIFCSPLOWO2_12_FULL_48_11]
MKNKKGKFFVLEGGEGSGKSSQLKKLSEYFGERVLITREPGGSPYAEEIRSLILNSENAKQADAKTHFALFWAARADHLKNTILPALARRQNVLVDRFDSSTYAYQVFAQEASELKDFFWKMRQFYLGKNIPSRYFFLDVEPSIGLARKQKQKREVLNHFDERDVQFHTRMRKGFLDFFKQVPYSTIDANQPFDTVTMTLVTELKKYII